MENASRHITAKFDLAAQFLDQLEAPAAEAALTALRIELEAIRTRYALCTAHLFFRAAGGESGRQLARDDFQRIVAAEGFVGEVDHLVCRMRARLGLAADGATPAEASAAREKRAARRKPERDEAPALREAQAILKQYAGCEIDCAARAVEQSVSRHGDHYKMCADCKVEMAVNADTSELECPGCGKTRELIGTVFDDAQFYNQEGQKAKSGSFNPNRHYQFWMNHLLAREPEEELGDKDDPDNSCGEKLVADLRGLVRRDRRILRLLTVDDLRGMLFELKRTILNKNVPLLMKKVTGVGPPQLPESICQRVEKNFSLAIEIDERIRPLDRQNRKYYPFYIYKILDALLEEDDLDNRRILYYIYMQGDDTLEKNDREWEEICAELPEITWTPTDRTKAQRYRPQ